MTRIFVLCGDSNGIFPPTRMGCGKPIHSDDDLFRCWDCGVPYHRDCGKNGPCAATKETKTFFVLFEFGPEGHRVTAGNDPETLKAEAQQRAGLQLIWGPYTKDETLYLAKAGAFAFILTARTVAV